MPWINPSNYKREKLTFIQGNIPEFQLQIESTDFSIQHPHPKEWGCLAYPSLVWDLFE